MKLSILSALFLPLCAFAESLTSTDCAASLSVPEGWIRQSLSEDPVLQKLNSAESLVPKESIADPKSRRKIHFRLSGHQGNTLEDAMNKETDNITKRSQSASSSNGREGFQGKKSVETASGLKGIVGEFGWKDRDGPQFAINKFYFKNAAGKIFVVCAHIYGDRKLADEFQDVILKNLTLAPPH